MCKKAILSMFLVSVLGTSLISGQAGKNAVDVILSGYSAKAFSSEPVSDKDILTILECGNKAPSAMNKQPWRFTVIKDNILAAEIVKNFTPGNVLIVVSGVDSPAAGSYNDFDCALATQNMYIAAQGLGLGSHIYASPVKDINSTKKTVLGIPEGFRAICVLRIGHIDTKVDATSAASPRNKMETVVTHK